MKWKKWLDYWGGRQVTLVSLTQKRSPGHQEIVPPPSQPKKLLARRNQATDCTIRLPSWSHKHQAVRWRGRCVFLPITSTVSIYKKKQTIERKWNTASSGSQGQIHWNDWRASRAENPQFWQQSEPKEPKLCKSNHENRFIAWWRNSEKVIDNSMISISECGNSS